MKYIRGDLMERPLHKRQQAESRATALMSRSEA